MTSRASIRAALDRQDSTFTLLNTARAFSVIQRGPTPRCLDTRTDAPHPAHRNWTLVGLTGSDHVTVRE
jgi:hypothetical protein